MDAAPLRPPGWLWVDSSDYSHLVVCERCKSSFGPYFTKEQAQAISLQHRQTHADAEAFGWVGYSHDRLIKNPGGRPPRPKTTCTENDCTEEAKTLGMCRRHYQRFYYQTRRAKKAS